MLLDYIGNEFGSPRGIEPLFPAIEASVLTTGHGASE